MENIREYEEYSRFATRANLHKALTTLKGILCGIGTDGEIGRSEFDELTNWCMLHQDLKNHIPFCDLLEMIPAAYEDGFLTPEEINDILWVCDNFETSSEYYKIRTTSVQFLFGLLHGVMADGALLDDEIKKIQEWIVTNDFLEGSYPYDEIHSLISSVLLDGKVTREEREMLMAYFGEFIDTSMSYNIDKKDMEELKAKYSIQGICAICQEIDFDGKLFSFTGKTDKASRKEIAKIIEDCGGKYKDSIVEETDYLIVGNLGNPCWAYSCYGRKIEKAVKMRKEGKNISIINEIDFWDIVNDL